MPGIHDRFEPLPNWLNHPYSDLDLEAQRLVRMTRAEQEHRQYVERLTRALQEGYRQPDTVFAAAEYDPEPRGREIYTDPYLFAEQHRRDMQERRARFAAARDECEAGQLQRELRDDGASGVGDIARTRRRLGPRLP